MKDLTHSILIFDAKVMEHFALWTTKASSWKKNV